MTCSCDVKHDDPATVLVEKYLILQSLGLQGQSVGGSFIFSILVYPAVSFINQLGLSLSLSLSSVSKKLKIQKKIIKAKSKKMYG